MCLGSLQSTGYFFYEFYKLWAFADACCAWERSQNTASRTSYAGHCCALMRIFFSLVYSFVKISSGSRSYICRDPGNVLMKNPARLRKTSLLRYSQFSLLAVIASFGISIRKVTSYYFQNGEYHWTYPNIIGHGCAQRIAPRQGCAYGTIANRGWELACES